MSLFNCHSERGFFLSLLKLHALFQSNNDTMNSLVMKSYFHLVDNQFASRVFGASADKGHASEKEKKGKKNAGCINIMAETREWDEISA